MRCFSLPRGPNHPSAFFVFFWTNHLSQGRISMMYRAPSWELRLKVMSGKAMKEYEIQWLSAHESYRFLALGDSLIRKEGIECRFRNLACLDCMILSYFIALTKPSPQSTCWKKHARLMQQHMLRKPFVWKDLVWKDLETVLSDLVAFQNIMWIITLTYWLQSQSAKPQAKSLPPRPRTHRDEFQKPPDKQVLISDAETGFLRCFNSPLNVRSMSFALKTSLNKSFGIKKKQEQQMQSKAFKWSY